MLLGPIFTHHSKTPPLQLYIIRWSRQKPSRENIDSCTLKVSPKIPSEPWLHCQKPSAAY